MSINPLFHQTVLENVCRIIVNTNDFFTAPCCWYGMTTVSQRGGVERIMKKSLTCDCYSDEIKTHFSELRTAEQISEWIAGQTRV